MSTAALETASVAGLRTWREKSRPRATQKERSDAAVEVSAGAGASSARADSRARSCSCKPADGADRSAIRVRCVAWTVASAVPSTDTSACAPSGPPKFTSKTPRRSCGVSWLKLAESAPARKSHGAKICHLPAVPPLEPALTTPVARPPGRASTHTPDAAPGSTACPPFASIAPDTGLPVSRSASCTRYVVRGAPSQKTSTAPSRADARTLEGGAGAPQASAASRQRVRRMQSMQARAKGFLRMKPGAHRSARFPYTAAPQRRAAQRIPHNYKPAVIRTLRPGDEPALEAFLAPHWERSMFLRANARRGGLSDRGQPLQATYAAAFRDGAIVAVAAHCWNGILLVQAPEQLEDVARAALRVSGRALAGISGPADQVRAARDLLGVRRASMDDTDALFSLELEALRVPAGFSRTSLRRPRDAELPALIGWREQYLVETGLAARGPSLHDDAKTSIEQLHARGDHWVLEDGGDCLGLGHDNLRGQRAPAMMRAKSSAFKLAPPTSAPSMSGWPSRSAAFSGFTDPPYWIRTASATAGPASSRRRPRICACTSCACAVVAVLPVPMAQTGS